ncbi:helix-turn-helix transcriptional regulator [Phaeobacter sp. JH18-32]|uniref:response regulator transcription factor n=1 Tax=Phaeobacter TaxID=302485 RepID=UPI003A86D25C
MNHTSKDFEFLGRVSVAESIESYAEAAISHLSKSFSAQSVIGISYRRGGEPSILFRWIPDKELCLRFDQDYGKFGFMLDPYYQQAWLTEDWAAFPLRAIAPDRFETSDYFTAYFGATQMVDEMSFVARVSNNVSVSLSLGRNSGERRYRQGEINRFKQYCHVLAPKLRQIVVHQPPERTEDAKPLEQRFLALSESRGSNISKREAEVAALIVLGHSSRAIGLKLQISNHTVKVHRRSLYKKLIISSQNELFRLLVEYDWNTRA